MGHPTDIFTSDPDGGSCICTICHDVFKDAASFNECGHTFCIDCMKTSLQTNAACPNCRVDVAGYNPNYVVRDIIGSMQVKCPEGKGGDHQDNNSNKRKRGEGEEDCNAAASAQAVGCDWKGQLKDLKDHEITCEFKTVICGVDGCNHSCPRKDMVSHLSGLGVLVHMNLMKRSIVDGYETKIKGVETKCQEMIKEIRDLDMSMRNLRYVNDCRSWIEYKPDALFDFSIYQIRSTKARNLIVGLLCEIPGPKGTAWEGARIPMTLRYWVRGPPKCQFPAGFFHTNVYPSGTVCVSTINEEEGWTPETTLPEILFSVQQLLGHFNPSSPAQSIAYNVYAHEGLEQYQIRVKKEVEVYSDCARSNPKVKLGEGERVDTQEIIEKADRMMGGNKQAQERPDTPPFQRDANGRVKPISSIPSIHNNCECSCCAWGQVFWDDKKFGIGG
ncbi:hypothetical protein ACHAXR_012923 [Thalassiosira sp. AJA248-18]